MWKWWEHYTALDHTLAIHQHVDTTITAYNIQPHHTFTPSPLAIGDDEWSNIVVIVPIWSEHEARGETDQDFTACRQWLILTPLSSVSISIPNVRCFLLSELRQCNIILVGSRSITAPYVVAVTPWHVSCFSEQQSRGYRESHRTPVSHQPSVPWL